MLIGRNVAHGVQIQRHNPDEVARLLAVRIRAERLRLEWKQETLAERSGVSLPTVRRYERTGRTSLENLLTLRHVLGRLDEFADLLEPPPASSIDELAEQHHRIYFSNTTALNRTPASSDRLSSCTAVHAVERRTLTDPRINR